MPPPAPALLLQEVCGTGLLLSFHCEIPGVWAIAMKTLSPGVATSKGVGVDALSRWSSPKAAAYSLRHHFGGKAVIRKTLAKPSPLSVWACRR